ncbi:hypothetical protein DC415_15915 [Agrobacterium tumefaciens]|uniref:Uncharacterized protein n=1 Tax=Rhizobium rhizogenes TaxID=359 RepID=A0AA92H735_RHIRH|nr:hypothetical protein DC430_22935 [Rhizobium rhizogenes]PVE63937.1 hypothetical protein DC415_15915 [Agrobacterium tumefaciens]PVE73200.1 hypothetical protein DCP16_15915 [Sphingomonas sp. TPD3009]
MVLRENGLVSDALRRKNKNRAQQYSIKITENIVILLQFETVEVLLPGLVRELSCPLGSLLRVTSSQERYLLASDREKHARFCKR